MVGSALKPSRFQKPRRFFYLLALALLSNAHALDWETWDDSVIRLQASQGEKISTGTAFAINDQGHYVTNHHVIEEALNGWQLEAIESVNPPRSHAAEVIWHDAKRDLAVVRVASWQQPPLTLAAGDGLRKDTRVVTLGFPGGSDVVPGAGFTEPKLKRGVISLVQAMPLYEANTSLVMLEHDAVVNSGNSGGPLADDCGRVVGINSAKATTRVSLPELAQGRINITEGTFFSISSNELLAALQAQNIPFNLDKTACQPPTAAASVWLYSLAAVSLLLFFAVFYVYWQLKQLLPAGAGVKHVSRLLVSRLQGKPFVPPPHRPIRDPETGKVLDPDQPTAARLVPLDKHLPTLNLRLGAQIIGRAEAGQAEVLIPDSHVSARHARLMLNPDGTASVEDLHATNGTFIEQQRLSTGQLYPLGVGQKITFGSVVYQLSRSH